MGEITTHHCIIMARQALIQFVGAFTVSVAVTLTLDAAVSANIAEIALTFVRLDTLTANAA